MRLLDCTPPALLQLLPAPKGLKNAKDLPLQNRPRHGGQNPPDALFLDGNATPTIPHKHGKNKNSCFPAGCADAAVEDGRRNSNVYQVNTWLWQFGRGKPRLGGLTIEETGVRQDAARKALDKRRKEARGGRNDAPA